MDWYAHFSEVYRKKPHYSKSHYLMTLRSECVRMNAVNIRYPTNHLRARLGCEYARTMYRFYRRNANGTRLGRWSWTWVRKDMFVHVMDRHVPLLSYISEEW